MVEDEMHKTARSGGGMVLAPGLGAQKQNQARESWNICNLNNCSPFLSLPHSLQKKPSRGTMPQDKAHQAEKVMDILPIMCVCVCVI